MEQTRLIDTHTHLYVEQFEADRKEVIERAIEKGVEAFYLPNIDSKSIPGMLQLEREWPDHCFAMMGLHPCSVGTDYQEELATVRNWLDQRPFVAIGEIGIDLYWDKTYRKQQEEAFLQQAAWAIDLKRPIVIHSRESIDLLIELIRELNDDQLYGIFHCFTGTIEQAEAIQDLGFILGIGGVLSFKNAGLDKVLKQVPLESMVLETDSPYLAPVPYRGKRNESGYLLEIARRLAEVKNCTLDDIATQTTVNARRIFA